MTVVGSATWALCFGALSIALICRALGYLSQVIQSGWLYGSIFALLLAVGIGDTIYARIRR